MPEPTPLIDYTFESNPIANADGTFPATQVSTVATTGPGATLLGPRPKARRFNGSGSRIVGAADVAQLDASRFAIRVVMRVTAPVTDRANLFEADLPACSLHLLPNTGLGDFRVMATVDNAQNGWTGVDSFNRIVLKVGNWYTLDLIYDIDTLALLIDGALIGVTAFPAGAASARTTANFVMGVHPDLVRWPFHGDIAALQIFAGIPSHLEAQLDDARGNEEWRIRLKENSLRLSFDLGTRAGDIAYEAPSTMSLQAFANVHILAAAGSPAAFEIHGAIRDRYFHGQLGSRLGVLLSDEQDTRLPGARRNVFEKGAIYWSALTGAWEVYGLFYLTYERLGGSVSVLGLPLGPPDNIAGGMVQVFQHGLMYLKDGAPRAFEVHGAIAEHYLAIGGPGKWGFPIGDEEDVDLIGTGLIAPTPTGARKSRFEGCTIYWSSATGAHEVHGAIGVKYEDSGGAGLPHDDEFNGLGLPLTDEQDLPAWAGPGRFNAFQFGSIVWKNGTAVACTEFQIHLGMVQTEEDEGWGQGENDLFFQIRLKRNGPTIVQKREPGDGAFDGDNSHDLNLLLDPVFTPNDPNLRLRLEVEVWDEDDGLGFKDNRLGTITADLDIGNAWGLLIAPDGRITSSDDEVQSFEWDVRPRWLPAAKPDFWELRNRSTQNLTRAQFAAAFSDIDDDPEWSDPEDWKASDFFSDKIEGAARGGNCFGMVDGAYHAWHGGEFGLPLSRFTVWESVRSEINIQQIGWFGSECIAEHSGQTDRGINAIQVFKETKDRNAAGRGSVISMWSNKDYSGSGHSVMPIAWDDSSFPWKIEVFDPNGGNTPTTITVAADSTFSFNNAGLAFSGSIEYTPWEAIDHRQCSPVWDPTMLFFALLIVAVGSDAETVSITDTRGDNLLLSDNPNLGKVNAIYGARFMTQVNPQFAGQFGSLSAPNGEVDGELFVRRVRRAIPGGFGGAGKVLDHTLGQALKFSQAALASNAMDRVALNPQPLPPRLAGRLLRAQLPDSALHRTLRSYLRDESELPIAVAKHASVAELLGGLRNWLHRQSSAFGPDFVHHMRGKRNGTFDYRTRFRLADTLIKGPLAAGEESVLRVEALDSRTPLHRLTTGRSKTVSIDHTVRMGRDVDFARIRIQNIPVRAGLDLKVSLRPGITAVDVFTAAEPVNVPVEITTWRANQPMASRQVRTFNVPMEGGLRLTPKLFDASGALKVGRINSVFGEPRDAVVLKGV